VYGRWSRCDNSYKLIDSAYSVTAPNIVRDISRDTTNMINR
jgi:hypothetical protein